MADEVRWALENAKAQLDKALLNERDANERQVILAILLPLERALERRYGPSDPTQ